MSAEGEIVIETLTDVVMIPLQAVNQEKGETVVYLADRGMERRIVETGSFNTSFIEIKSGLEGGETVALRAPTSSKREEDNNESDEESESEEMVGDEAA